MSAFAFALTLLASVCSAFGSEDDFLLMWQVDDPLVSQIGGGTVYLHDFIGTSEQPTADWGARVYVSDNNGYKEYLNIWYRDGGVPVSSGNNDGIVFDIEHGDYRGGPAYAGIGNYVYKGANNEWTSGSYVFALEIGYWDAADNFVAKAQSEEWSYNNFVSNAPVDPSTGNRLSYIQSSELQIPNAIAWSGGAYAAPEPSSGLLLAIGSALLALRRRKPVKGEGAA